MAFRDEVDRVVAILDNLYRTQPDACISSNEIVRQAQDAQLSADFMFFFNRERLDRDCYTRGDLADALNRLITRQGKHEQIGTVH